VTGSEISSANKYLLLILSTDKQWHFCNFKLPGLVVFKSWTGSGNKYHSPRSFQQIEFSISKNFFLLLTFRSRKAGTFKIIKRLVISI
jgi:hypothetical protein